MALVECIGESDFRRNAKASMKAKPNNDDVMKNQMVKETFFLIETERMSIGLDGAIADGNRSARFTVDLSFANHGATRLT